MTCCNQLGYHDSRATVQRETHRSDDSRGQSNIFVKGGLVYSEGMGLVRLDCLAWLLANDIVVLYDALPGLGSFPFEEFQRLP